MSAAVWVSFLPASFLPASFLALLAGLTAAMAPARAPPLFISAEDGLPELQLGSPVCRPTTPLTPSDTVPTSDTAQTPSTVTARSVHRRQHTWCPPAARPRDRHCPARCAPCRSLPRCAAACGAAAGLISGTTFSRPDWQGKVTCLACLPTGVTARGNRDGCGRRAVVTPYRDWSQR